MKWVGIVLKGRAEIVLEECRIESRCGWRVAVIVFLRRELRDASLMKR